MSTDGRPSYSRSLDDVTRRRAFGVAAVVLVVATVGIGLLPDAKRDPPRPKGERANVVGAQSTTAQRSAASTRARTLVAADRRAVLARARAFLRAYLAYEVGATDADVTRSLQQTASRSLAKQLLAQRPAARPVDPPPRGHVSAIELGDASDPQMVVVTATISHSGRLSRLTLQLDRERDTWRVSRIS